MPEQNADYRDLHSAPHLLPMEQPGPATILVVEDSRTLNRTLCDLLTARGYQVLSAENGMDALEILDRQPVDLVLADVVMPGLDGYGLLEQIRDDPDLHQLPVVFLTGYATPNDRRKALEHGVEDYLAKPLDETDLLATIHNVLYRRTMIEENHQRHVEAVRNQILALVQHEFRTPLTFVIGYAEYLHSALDAGLGHEELQRSVEAILEGSQRLHDLVESFLTLASLSETSLDPEDLYPIDPTGLWRESLNAVRRPLEEARLQVHLVEPSDPLIVFGVMDLLREALVRLLDNAIRYRRPDSRRIWLSTEGRDGFVGWIIHDEGIGIPPEQLAQILQPFSRLSKRSSGLRGAGLGLTLVQRVAEFHGGFLTVESQPDVGSTFGLWVPDTEPIRH